MINNLSQRFPNSTFDILLPKIINNQHFVKIDNGKIDLTKNDGSKVTTKLYLSFQKFLHQMLGFEDEEINQKLSNAKYPIDIHGNTQVLFVYTNIIKESYGGNNKSQLLRMIPLEKTTDKINYVTESISFNPIIFYPLRLLNFDVIEIQIRDSTGDMIIFESGKVICTLMLRKKQRNNFF